MHHPEYSSVDPETGNVKWDGPLGIEPGNHKGMTPRTDAYLPGDEKGHVNASSTGGVNNNTNVVPQNADLNHGAYYSMEKGERTALQNGASINSEKTAVVDSQPGDRPYAFTVNDTVTYADGHSEEIHHSFTNESNAAQEEWNNMSASFPDTYEAPNPGDSLRDSMETSEYTELMEETDMSLVNLDAEYEPADFSGDPYAMVEMENDADVDMSDDVDDGIDDDGIDDGCDDDMDI